MDDTQKFDKTYVNLKDVLDMISVFYDTTLFCKRDTDQPKMLCDAIKKSNRVHSIVLDEEYMKERFKKEFGDCVSDVYKQHFEYVLKYLRDDIIISLHDTEYRQVPTMNDVETIIRKKFNEVIGE